MESTEAMKAMESMESMDARKAAVDGMVSPHESTRYEASTQLRHTPASYPTWISI